MMQRLIIVAVMLVSGFAGCECAAQDAIGTVSRIQGEASGTRNGATRALAPNSAVFLNETVATGETARLEVTFTDNTRLTLGEKAKLTLKNSLDDAKDRLSWSWTSSAAVPPADFENPVEGANDYTLCLYDQTGFLLGAAAPAGGVCGTRPCWKRTGSSSLVYRDKLLDPDGLETVVLKPGASAGKAKITVKGKGANLALPGLSLTTPVRVQVLRSMSTCWEATFSAASRNDSEVFKARSDP